MSNTESFDSVISDMRLRAMGGPWATMADRLQYDHHQEIRDVGQKEYHRGYEDGKRSMDAVHRAVAIRLRQLPLDGDTTENLGAIAGAIYHSDFGWTQGACAALRDELVHLMGGTEGIAKEGKSGTADDSGVDSDCGDCGCNFHIYELSAEKRIEKLVRQRNELKAKLDQYDATHIELPKDADGVSVRVGDRVRTKHDATYTVARITREDYKDTTTWYIEDFAANYSLGPEDLTHYKPADTAESIVRELTLGSITEEEAITRIEALHGNP